MIDRGISETLYLRGQIYNENYLLYTDNPYTSIYPQLSSSSLISVSSFRDVLKKEMIRMERNETLSRTEVSRYKTLETRRCLPWMKRRWSRMR